MSTKHLYAAKSDVIKNEETDIFLHALDTDNVEYLKLFTNLFLYTINKKEGILKIIYSNNYKNTISFMSDMAVTDDNSNIDFTYITKDDNNDKVTYVLTKDEYISTLKKYSIDTLNKELTFNISDVLNKDAYDKLDLANIYVNSEQTRIECLSSIELTEEESNKLISTINEKQNSNLFTLNIEIKNIFFNGLFHKIIANTIEELKSNNYCIDNTVGLYIFIIDIMNKMYSEHNLSYDTVFNK